MRLDLFLKVSRLSPRRSVAQKLCDAGLVLLNDQPVKPAHEVKANDVITLRRHDRETQVRVRAVPDTKNVAKRNAAELVEVIAEKHFESSDF